MGATNSTTNFHFPLFISSDVPAWMTDWNNAMQSIDSSLQTIKESADGASGTAGTAKTAADSAVSAVTQMQTTLTSLQGTVSTLGTTVSSLSSGQEVINQQITTLNGQMSTANGNISSLQSANLSTNEILNDRAWIVQNNFASSSVFSAGVSSTAYYNKFLKLLILVLKGTLNGDKSSGTTIGTLSGEIVSAIGFSSSRVLLSAFTYVGASNDFVSYPQATLLTDGSIQINSSLFNNQTLISQCTLCTSNWT